MPPALVLLMTFASPATPPEPPVVVSRGETSGLALSVELGRHALGYGLGATYYQPFRAIAGLPVTLFADVGAGVWGRVPRALVGAAGMGAGLGRKHRGLLRLGWAVIGRSILSLHGTRVADRSLYGPEVQGGYELVSDAGPVVRALVGGAYLPRDWQESRFRWQATFSVGVGWKFW
jgi:hypothetical protein